MKENEELDNAIKLLKRAIDELDDLYSGCNHNYKLINEIESFIKVVEDNREKREHRNNINSKEEWIKMDEEEELNKIFRIQSVGQKTTPIAIANLDKNGFTIKNGALEIDNKVDKVEVKMGIWLNKKYDIYYSPFNDNYNTKLSLTKHIIGTLINYDRPFVGRFFMENENGSLTIIPMSSVVLMTEAK